MAKIEWTIKDMGELLEAVENSGMTVTEAIMTLQRRCKTCRHWRIYEIMDFPENNYLGYCSNRKFHFEPLHSAAPGDGCGGHERNPS